MIHRSGFFSYAHDIQFDIISLMVSRSVQQQRQRGPASPLPLQGRPVTIDVGRELCLETIRMTNSMYFEIIGEIEGIESIAIGGGIRGIMRLQRQFGSARWRKLKGFAKVRLQSGRMR